MQYTVNYNLKKPEGTDIVNIDDLNDNADILDQKLKEVENKADNAPPNSVNDAAIGSRTPDQSQAPASPGTGTLTQLISWLANRIKAITGKTNWWDAPPTTLQAAKNHIDAAAPHSGHETPSGAQAKANTAEANAKAYTDAHEQKAAPHSGHETTAGAQAKADAAEANAKAYTDAAEANAKAYTDAHEQKAAPHSGHETTAGAQAKANAAETNAKNHANSLVGTLSNLLTTAKNNVVAAVNEIFGKVEDVEDSLATHLAENVSQSGGVHGFDIEVGTFTPLLIATTVEGNHTYTRNLGWYIRLGNVCKFSVSIEIPSGGLDKDIEGSIRIGGLPFISQAATHRRQSVSLGRISNVDYSGSMQLLGYMEAGRNYVSFSLVRDSSTPVALTQANLAEHTTIFELSGIYVIN